MGITTRKTTTIATVLTKKAGALRDKQARDAAASDAHAVAASNLALDSTTAAKQADAVEQALSIVEAAGVDL